MFRKQRRPAQVDGGSAQQLDKSMTTEELAVLESGMWRGFLGACLLCGMITLISLYMLARAEAVPQVILVGFPSIMLWSLAVTLHAHHNLFRFARQVKTALLQRTFMDEATGVFNFAYLNQRLTEEFERIHRYGGSAGVLFVDLDHFKQVNDRFGHLAGNIVLRAIAATLRGQVRACDMFGRVGGDEFMALLPQTTRDQAMVIAERLRESVENQSVRLSADIAVDFVRASIGIAIYPDNGDSMEGVVTAADHAVYAAKDLGGNKVCASEDFIAHEAVDGAAEHNGKRNQSTTRPVRE